VFAAQLIRRNALVLGALSVFWCVAAMAQSHKGFPSGPVDHRTLRAQERVEELYESGEYRRAFLIYEKELAPIGDKYAQYMVGYMYLTGQYVPKSGSAALAWYRLAAERGEPAIVQARDELYSSLSNDDIAESNRLFNDVWQRLGDKKLLLDLIAEDMEILRERTGSRLAGGDPALTIINNRAGPNAGDRFYDHVRNRVKSRLDYLETEVEVSDIALESDVDDIQTIEDEIRKEFAAIR